MKDYYIAHVIEEYISDGNFNAVFGDDWIDEARLAELIPMVCNYAFAEYGIDAKGQYSNGVAAIFEGLKTNDGIVCKGDEYSGFWFRLRPQFKEKYLASLRSQNPATDTVGTLGEESLRRALNRIMSEDGLRSMDEKWAETLDRDPSADGEARIQIPASDRFVTLGHNQQADLDQASTEVIEALEKENSVDGDPSARAWMLGQLRAGRELIRAQVVNVWLMEQTVLSVLGTLIEKFKGHAISAAAQTLLELLIKYLFGVK